VIRIRLQAAELDLWCTGYILKLNNLHILKLIYLCGSAGRTTPSRANRWPPRPSYPPPNPMRRRHPSRTPPLRLASPPSHTPVRLSPSTTIHAAAPSPPSTDLAVWIPRRSLLLLLLHRRHNRPRPVVLALPRLRWSRHPQIRRLRLPHRLRRPHRLFVCAIRRPGSTCALS
jgi:hypothetical protein